MSDVIIPDRRGLVDDYQTLWKLKFYSKGSDRAGPSKPGHLLLCRHAGPEGPANRGADPDKVCAVTSEIHQHQVCGIKCTLANNSAVSTSHHNRK